MSLYPDFRSMMACVVFRCEQLPLMMDDDDDDDGSDGRFSEQFLCAVGTNVVQKSDERIAVAVMVRRVFLPGVLFIGSPRTCTCVEKCPCVQFLGYTVS